MMSERIQSIDRYERPPAHTVPARKPIRPGKDALSRYLGNESPGTPDALTRYLQANEKNSK